MKTNSSAFTLVETLIAVTILTLAVTGPLFTASRAVVAAQISRDRLTASYLAQQGVEYVRAMRDDAYLHAYQIGGQTVSSSAWKDFTTGTSARSIAACKTASCTLDPTRTMGTGSGLALNTCSGTCAPLYLDTVASDSTYGYNQQNIGTATGYTRTIKVSDVAGSNGSEVAVSSVVSWTYHGTTYTITDVDHITSWQ